MAERYRPLLTNAARPATFEVEAYNERSGLLRPGFLDRLHELAVSGDPNRALDVGDQHRALGGCGGSRRKRQRGDEQT